MALLMKPNGISAIVNPADFPDSRPSSNDSNSLSFSLEQLQKFVGGYIQAVYPYGKKEMEIASSQAVIGGEIVRESQKGIYVFAYANEEGIIEKLPFNPVASHLLGQPLVGDILFLTKKEFEDD